MASTIPFASPRKPRQTMTSREAAQFSVMYDGDPDHDSTLVAVLEGFPSSSILPLHDSTHQRFSSSSSTSSTSFSTLPSTHAQSHAQSHATNVLQGLDVDPFEDLSSSLISQRQISKKSMKNNLLKASRKRKSGKVLHPIFFFGIRQEKRCTKHFKLI